MRVANLTFFCVCVVEKKVAQEQEEEGVAVIL